MAEILLETQQITYDDMDDIMYKFKFVANGTERNKIQVQKSQLKVFKFCLDNYINFHDGTRIIKFVNQSSYTDMTIQIPNQTDIHYKLFDSEKQAWGKYLTDNGLL